MPLYISVLRSLLPSLFLSTVTILTGLSHSTHAPYIVLSLRFKSSMPTRLIKRGLKQKTTYYENGGNGDDDEAPDHQHYLYSSAEFLAVRVVEAL